MKIYTEEGELAITEFDFSDGQPHLKFETLPPSSLMREKAVEVTIETALTSPRDLVMVKLAQRTLIQLIGNVKINLDIRYMLGARMDRAISIAEPFTLLVMAELLRAGGIWNRVRVLDAHSSKTTNLLGAYNVLPKAAVKSVLNSLERVGERVQIVVPDKGAIPRVESLVDDKRILIYADKDRDPTSGRINSIDLGVNGRLAKGCPCLILDDICDGGKTFELLAAELLKAGAKTVYLFVTHGIFSKGTRIPNVGRVYTTDSIYHGPSPDDIPSGLRGALPVVIPISMKDLK